MSFDPEDFFLPLLIVVVGAVIIVAFLTGGNDPDVVRCANGTEVTITDASWEPSAEEVRAICAAGEGAR